jgi:hypothetical protein
LGLVVLADKSGPAKIDEQARCQPMSIDRSPWRIAATWYRTALAAKDGTAMTQQRVAGVLEAGVIG